MSDFEDDGSGSDYISDHSDDFRPTKVTKKTGQKPLVDSTNNATTNGTKKSSTPSASSQYQRLSQLEHILKRPDTYIGSVERTGIQMWCFDAESERMVYKEVNIVPGLYKIFDEILVNAADNKIRDPSMRNIKIQIDAENNTIQVMNDGKGIPVEIHDKENMYIPEMIFGNLLTSSNYDDDQRKVTGGRNGYGAKLCNIFSTEFTVETADLSNGLVYKQTWTDNMSKVSKPKITKLKTKKEYTKISFKPDLIKFHMEALDNDILSILRRRVYDLCGTVRDCNIYLNEKRLPIKNFKAYVEMYVKAIAEKKEESMGDIIEVNSYPKIVHEVLNDHWEVAFAVSDDSFNQVSFVNSIATTSGGTHVKYISDQIVAKIIEAVKKQKGKKNMIIKPTEVKNKMFIFVNCLVENPAFTSQTKEQLTTRVSQFAGTSNSSKVSIPDQFISRILKTSIVDEINSVANANRDKALQKGDGSRKLRIRGQIKLHDANKAGTREGWKCTLILTEGDSALSRAVAGLAVVGRDYYGCFPLKGKLLNVREASVDQISKNSEINALKQIIGLQHKKRYDSQSIKSLRYGHIMIMADQDHDGSHIKGLIINFLESSFPGLLETPGFLQEFITPIVKVKVKNRNKTETIPFYNMPDFEAWRSTEGTRCRWTQKYYKGLGTSMDSEIKEYFLALDKHMKMFHAIQGDDSQSIDLAFSKKKADDRKEWLRAFQPGTQLDPTLTEIPISDFINKELILFSMADNVRSIPSMLDGFKPGQRKVLFGCFKRNLRSEIKVSELTAYVSGQTGYHHGDQSLVQTIIGMAQDFVGSNNINLLEPIGAFGTRLSGGKDFAAARYINTNLNELTRKIFNRQDEPIYTYVQDDEQTVEPEWYLPVLPMVLVNGAEGIGTGWSTNIPSFNPEDLVNNIRKLMVGEEMQEMTPWYKGWTGSIERSSRDKFKVTGRILQIDENTLEITELPIKTWIYNMKEFLMSGLDSEKGTPWIKDIEERHNNYNVHFVVKLSKEEMEKSLKIGLEERFKLTSSISMANMVAMDPFGKIKKYDSPLEIIKDYYYVRLEYYQRRKDNMSNELQNQLTKLSEQARFIKLIIEHQFSVSNKKRSQLVEELEKHKFVKFNTDGTIAQAVSEPFMVNEEEIMEEVEEEVGDVSRLDLSRPGTSDHLPETSYSQYDYLLGMSLWTLTKERYERLLKQRDERQEELTTLLKKSARDLWNHDLDEFLKAWTTFLKDDEEKFNSQIPTLGSKTKAKRRRTKKDTNDTEPPKKKPTKVKKETAEEVTTTPSKENSSSTLLSTPLADNKDNKVKKEKSDILSFFSRPESELRETTETQKSKTSRFNDSDDDELLFSSSFGSASVPPKSSDKEVSSKKLTVDDELADLQSDLKFDAPTTRRRKSAKNIDILEESDDDDDEGNDYSDGDDDDDDESYTGD